jgi:hypothetical protein
MQNIPAQSLLIPLTCANSSKKINRFKKGNKMSIKKILTKSLFIIISLGTLSANAGGISAGGIRFIQEILGDGIALGEKLDPLVARGMRESIGQTTKLYKARQYGLTDKELARVIKSVSSSGSRNFSPAIMIRKGIFTSDGQSAKQGWISIMLPSEVVLNAAKGPMNSDLLEGFTRQFSNLIDSHMKANPLFKLSFLHKYDVGFGELYQPAFNISKKSGGQKANFDLAGIDGVDHMIFNFPVSGTDSAVDLLAFVKLMDNFSVETGVDIASRSTVVLE